MTQIFLAPTVNNVEKNKTKKPSATARSSTHLYANFFKSSNSHTPGHFRVRRHAVSLKCQSGVI